MEKKDNNLYFLGKLHYHMTNRDLRLSKPEFRKVVVMKNTFRDSVFLLKVTDQVRKIPGVREALIGMGTETNVQLIKGLGLWGEDLSNVQPNDLMIVVVGNREQAVNDAVSLAKSLLEGERGEWQYSSVLEALSAFPDTTLVVVSVPGQYVREVTLPVIEKGINVHIFSDNVPIEDEVYLKNLASQRGCLVLGPGAGTVLIKGVGTGFANKVRIGSVGISASSGTGLQELSSLLSESGAGISYGLGVGGNDVKDSVGGIMMIKTLKFLEEDPDTSVVNVISKEPDPSTAEKVMRYIETNVTKPTVVTFLGPSGRRARNGRVIYARTIHQAAASTAKLLGEEILRNFTRRYGWDLETIRNVSASLSFEGKLVALLTGGTFANEGTLILSASGLEVSEEFNSGNTVLDMGDERYTKGRPHPMIDPTIRVSKIKELSESQVGLLLLDFVLGFGAHPDPVGAHLDVINQFIYSAEKVGRKVSILAHVCGTSGDPQGLEEQNDKLKSLGVRVFPSNALMFLVAAGALRRDWEKLRSLYQEFIEVVS